MTCARWPCCGGTPPILCAICPDFTDSTEWAVTISGAPLAQNINPSLGCNVSVNINGTFVLVSGMSTHPALSRPCTGCCFYLLNPTSSPPLICTLYQQPFGTGAPTWLFQMVFNPSSSLCAIGVLYQLPVSSWNCAGPNVMTNVGQTWGAFPPTLTFTRIN